MTPLALVLALATAGADPHSFGNPESVRVTHVSLDLDLRFDQRRIAGTAELSLEYADAQAARLDLDTRDLTLREVKDAESGRPLEFALEPPVEFLGRRLSIVLPAPRPRRVRIAYETAPDATALQWLAPSQTTSGKLPFLFTQSQSVFARTWIPCQDSPGARVTYDATVRVPKGMTAVMSAEHGRHEPAQGLFRFRMPHSVPPYLIALAAGEIDFRPLGERTGVYAEPAVVDNAAHEFADMEKMLVAAEALYGRYAWGRWDAIVLPPSFPFGGMENPRLTFATPTLIAGDRSLTSVMAHELAHSWSGNLVTNATWSDFWLNEGVTTYIENRIDEALYGRELAGMLELLGLRELRETLARLMPERPDDTRLALELGGRDPEDSGGAVVYEKGAAFLFLIERHVGRARFDPFLRRYFDAHAFQSITTRHFLDFLRRELFQGDDAAWSKLKVEEWVHGRGLPDNVPEPASTRFDATRAAAAAFAASGAAGGIRKDWLTAEWLDFLGSLPRPLPLERMADLDRRFALSQAGNSEVLFAWLMLAVKSAYAPAHPALEGFLTRQGRLKFVRPLYRAMREEPATRELARKVYDRARPTYHPITVAALDAVFAK